MSRQNRTELVSCASLGEAIDRAVELAQGTLRKVEKRYLQEMWDVEVYEIPGRRPSDVVHFVVRYNGDGSFNAIPA